MDSSVKALIPYFFCCAGHCAELSIMLSASEEAAIIRAQEQARTGNKGPGPTSGSLRLDGIIYSHQNSWTVWLNGHVIKPGQKIETIRIVKVTPDTVDLIWSPNPGEYHQISLKPNEVFQPSTIVP